MTPFAITVDEEIRAIASMASLALALLAFFTNLRRDALKAYLVQVPAFGWKTLLDTLPDLVLAVFTGGAVIVMAPLCFDSFHFADLGHRSGAVPSMFALIWLGFIFVLLFQLSMVGIRFVEAIKARFG